MAHFLTKSYGRKLFKSQILIVPSLSLSLISKEKCTVEFLWKLPFRYFFFLQCANVSNFLAKAEAAIFLNFVAEKVFRQKRENEATASVTKFGKISQLGQTFKNLWQTMIFYLMFGKI